MPTRSFVLGFDLSQKFFNLPYCVAVFSAFVWSYFVASNVGWISTANPTLKHNRNTF